MTRTNGQNTGTKESRNLLGEDFEVGESLESTTVMLTSHYQTYYYLIYTLYMYKLYKDLMVEDIQ